MIKFLCYTEIFKKRYVALLLFSLCVMLCTFPALAQDGVQDAIEYRVYDTYRDGEDILGYFSFTYHGCDFEFCVSKIEDGRKLVEVPSFRTQDDRTGSLLLNWEAYQLGKEANPENNTVFLCRDQEDMEYVKDGEIHIYYFGVYRAPAGFDNILFSPSILEIYVDPYGTGEEMINITYNAETTELIGHMVYTDWWNRSEDVKHLAYVDWNSAPQLIPITADSKDSVDIPQVFNHSQYGDMKYVTSFLYEDYRFDFYEGKYRIVILNGPGLNRFILDDESGWAGPDGNAWYYDQNGKVSWDSPEWVIKQCLEIGK